MLGLLGLWLLYWSLLKDRAKGRRRCPKCWYNMSATKGLRCSECGYEAKREKKLYKTHRRWRWVFVAIVLLIAGHVTHTAPRIQKAGWIGTIPTTALITVFPWQHKMKWNSTLASQPGWDWAITKELERRIKANETWHWQNHRLAWIPVNHIINRQILDQDSRSQVYHLYRVIGKDSSVVYPQLLKLVKSKKIEIMMSTGILLGQHTTDDPSILKGIDVLLNYKVDTVRQHALTYVVFCGKNNPDYVISRLLEAMNDPSPRVISSAIYATTRLEPVDNKLLSRVEEFLSHENEKVRAAASYVLDSMKATNLKLEYLKEAKNPAVPFSPDSQK